MRLEQLGCGSHHRWQSDRPLRKFDLLARKELELDRLGIAREFEANLVRLSKNARQPRVRILHVKDRVLGGLLACEVEIEVELAVRLAEQEEESHDVRPNFIDQFVERHVGRLAGGHLDLLAAARERHKLVNDDTQRTDVMPERFDGGDHLLMFGNMVGTKHVDYQVVAGLQLLDMVRNVRGPVGRLPVRTGTYQYLIFGQPDGTATQPERAVTFN